MKSQDIVFCLLGRVPFFLSSYESFVGDNRQTASGRENQYGLSTPTKDSDEKRTHGRRPPRPLKPFPDKRNPLVACTISFGKNKKRFSGARANRCRFEDRNKNTSKSNNIIWALEGKCHLIRRRLTLALVLRTQSPD